MDQFIGWMETDAPVGKKRLLELAVCEIGLRALAKDLRRRS